MNCKYFSKCGSCTLYNLSYEKQLDFKVDLEKQRFSKFNIENFEIITSPTSNFRSRAEFRVWKDFDENNNITLSYAMNDFDKKIFKISSCLIVEEKIANLMPKLLEKLQQDEILSFKIFSIEFLSSSNDKVLVTLIYHKKLDEKWQKIAKILENELDIKIIGRSRGQKVIISEDFIINSFQIKNDTFHIKQYESSFTQPNNSVNTKMISWVLDNLKDGGNLCELYCGGGNFTIPLSSKFEKVLATEISKTSIKSAKDSCILNSIDNISFIRMSAEEFVEALNKKREFNRLKYIDLDSFDFFNEDKESTIFVDPPRAGLDETTLKLVQKFNQIIYISCNAQTLHRDLEEITTTHKIEKFAFFDQFAYTNHIECGVVLNKKL